MSAPTVDTSTRDLFDRDGRGEAMSAPTCRELLDDVPPILTGHNPCPCNQHMLAARVEAVIAEAETCSRFKQMMAPDRVLRLLDGGQP